MIALCMLPTSNAVAQTSSCPAKFSVHPRARVGARAVSTLLPHRTLTLVKPWRGRIEHDDTKTSIPASAVICGCHACCPWVHWEGAGDGTLSYLPRLSLDAEPTTKACLVLKELLYLLASITARLQDPAAIIPTASSRHSSSYTQLHTNCRHCQLCNYNGKYTPNLG